MNKTDLSVAIIFKNEIRCLERCLKSLQPLRERLSLQIVMADTGSTDGSRAVAERYADVLFDFPWINDFAAARNAVLDRCAGAWTLVVDCDEWLDGNIDELVRFVQEGKAELGGVVIRNYFDHELFSYGDVIIARLLRMNAALRYVGAIHETPLFNGKAGSLLPLRETILHHDGYVMLNDDSAEGKAKRTRNMALLRTELEKNPDDLRTICQVLDSEPDKVAKHQLLRRALPLVREHFDNDYAPPLFRNAVQCADTDNLPEYEEWLKAAEELLPDSALVRIDICYIDLTHNYALGHYEETIRRGESFLRACRKFGTGKGDYKQLSAGMLLFRNDSTIQTTRLLMASSYEELGQYERTYAKLCELRWNGLTETQTRQLLKLFARLRIKSELTLDSLMVKFWEGICEETPNKEYMEKRKEAFLKQGRKFFGVEKTETGEWSIKMGEKVAWRIFTPLQGKCPLGDSAALLSATTPERADEVLASINDLTQIHPVAFIHALKIGAEFPVPDRVLSTEEIAALAEKLLLDPPFLCEAAKFAASAAQTEQEIMWAYALAKVALNQATANLLPKEEEEEEEEVKWL